MGRIKGGVRMKVRLTSKNLIENSSFELKQAINATNVVPMGWYLDQSLFSSVSGVEWVQSNNGGHTMEYPEGLTFLEPEDINYTAKRANFLNYVSVIKSATARGEGVYYNKPLTPHVLARDYQTFTDIDSTAPESQDREYVQGLPSDTGIVIKDISTVLQIETELLRVPNYNYNAGKRVKIQRNDISREMTTESKYQPASTNLDFLRCKDEADALDLFFKTCIRYGVGFEVEAFITPDSAYQWGNFLWGEQQWGGIPAEGAYVKLFTIDMQGYSFNRSSTYGQSSVTGILQLTELNSVEY